MYQVEQRNSMTYYQQPQHVNKRPRVLVIDDEPNIAHLVADIIGDNGYQVTVALDGRQGLQLAQSGEFELVVADVMMPYVNGHDLCRSIKQNPRLKDVKVVLMSAVRRLAETGRAVGADAYLVKPFDVTDIDRLVENYLHAES